MLIVTFFILGYYHTRLVYTSLVWFLGSTSPD